VETNDGINPQQNQLTSLNVLELGWMVVGLSANTSNFALRAMQRFGTLQTEGMPIKSFISSTDLSIGGNKQTSSVLGSFSGMINRMWFITSFTNNADFESNYAYPSKESFSF
jgi:hypothetical protein